ncbi:translation initiation factor IF-2 subunit gamma [candidate division MSBL1 archaeon SCGC-AAA382A20]|uniref:protein-synthesizing GTPase n=1 Tax=candidate division MSBL1 archaeon SCGC-AAA382A20 TaxID=1698280 RepID=A0A133VK55_9EURY|nr:translation initiation factor IF-2 subunit gamma [candidate division MSBL1 archaeon SCGC-AAA382A20]
MPEIDERLIPQVNIGLVGHVDHGKSTLAQAISGKWTDTHSEEIKRGITIRLGYADATLYRCEECEEPKCYCTTEKCPACFEDTEPIRTISLVDVPGHKTLMGTVLSGAALMDGTILVIAADEPCPQPQTAEHLKALDIAGIENIIIVQNKIDRVSDEKARKNYDSIKEFVKGTVAEDAPIVPVSALQRVNIDALIQAIEEEIPTPDRDPEASPRMMVARSFDVNRPGTKLENLRGGVIGGSLIQGEFDIGDEIEIRPGIKRGEEVNPIKTEIQGLEKVGKSLESAGPGGLLGVQTSLDPSLTKSDNLGGSLAGYPGELPDLLNELTLEIHLFDKVVGLEGEKEVEKVRTNEPLMLTAGVAKTAGVVNSARTKDGTEEAEINLKLPVCAEKGDRIAISRQIENKWRLIGYGIIQ